MPEKTLRKDAAVRGLFIVLALGLLLVGCSGANRELQLPTGAEYLVVEGVGYEPPERPGGQARLAARLEATANARRMLWDQLMQERVSASGREWAMEDSGSASVGIVWLVSNDAVFASQLRAMLGDLQAYATRAAPKDRSVSVWLVLDRRDVLKLTSLSVQRLGGSQGSR